MESYYDIDEEIAWGPPTMQEIKNDILCGPGPKSRDTRHSAIAYLPKDLKSELRKTAKMVRKENVSVTSSEYYTPNETLGTVANCSNSQKVSEFVKESAPNNDVTNYSTATENIPDAETNCTSSRELQPSSSDLSYDSALDNMTKPTRFKHRDTLLNILKINNERQSCYLSNINHTLVETTIILSSDDEDAELSYMKEETTQTKFNTCTSSRKDEVIVIEDESSDEDISEVPNFEDADQDMQYALVKHELEITDRSCSSHESRADFVNDDGEDNKECGIEEKFKTLFKSQSDSEIYQSYDTEEDNFNKVSCSNTTLESIDPKSMQITDVTTSPITIPQIDIAQFDDSNDLLGITGLDDTLEEINRVLQQGLDYSMSHDVSECKPARELSIIAGSFKQITPAKQQFKSGIPRSIERNDKINKYNNIVSPIGAYIKASSAEKFKIPNKPKTCTPKPVVNLKNIVSPVGIYIKNNPSPCLKQNIPNREIKITASKVEKTRPKKENVVDVFPAVIYKPAKNTIVSTERKINLPTNIQKLVYEPCVTKHDRIKKTNLNESSVAKKLLHGELTSSSINESLLNNTNQDISILTNKQAYIQ